MLFSLVCGIRKAISDVQKGMCDVEKCQEKRKEEEEQTKFLSLVYSSLVLSLLILCMTM